MARATKRVAKRGKVSVRMYRQGLGDCFLVTIPYGEDKKFRIMFDCGLVLGAQNATALMQQVMSDVASSTEGEGIDLLVVTHPHWDHVSGFLQARQQFDALKVGAVWMPWTLDQKDPLQQQLSKVHAKAEQALFGVSVKAHELGDAATATEIDALLGFFGARAGSTLEAVEIAAKKGKPTRYCKPGEPPVRFPGVGANFYFLGPPRDEKYLRKMDPSSKAPETYALGSLAALLAVGSAFAPDASDDLPFGPNATIPFDTARQDPFFSSLYWNPADEWRKIDGDWLTGASDLAFVLDSAINNTSLAIAIELDGGDVLLFAADAQVGNWLSWLDLSWDLGGQKVTGPDLIARTVFYKVGHHASLNASLSDDGVEKMTNLKVAMVPTDAVEAEARHWGNNIPFPKLLEALSRLSGGRVIRSDQPAPAVAKATETTLYQEVQV